jgi:isopropylmalate/homocitrate/citramalate synthase
MSEQDGLEKYLFDWNNAEDMPMATPQSLKGKTVEIEDETPRDGVQATYLTRPDGETMQLYVNTVYTIGIRNMNAGFPASSEKQFNGVKSVAEYIRDKNLQIRLTCAARAAAEDIKPIIDIKNQTGVPFRVGMFLRSSTLGTLVEGWSRLKMIDMIKSNIDYANRNGLGVMFVAEDSTRAHPETLIEFYKTAIESGSDRICIADTVGDMQFEGVSRIMKFVQDEVVGSKNIPIEWHGHNDLGQALPNGLLAYRFGAISTHATFGGIGERTGNIPMEPLLISLWKAGTNIDPGGFRELRPSARLIEDWFGFQYPNNYPIMGEHAFNTATGPHARAIELAIEHPELKRFAEMVYSAVPVSMVDKESEDAEGYIMVGPQSGSSNPRMVLRYLRKQGVTTSKGEPIDETINPEIIEEVLQLTKQQDRILANPEVFKVYERMKDRADFDVEIEQIKRRGFVG